MMAEKTTEQSTIYRWYPRFRKENNKPIFVTNVSPIQDEKQPGVYKDLIEIWKCDHGNDELRLYEISYATGNARWFIENRSIMNGPTMYSLETSTGEKHSHLWQVVSMDGAVEIAYDYDRSASGLMEIDQNTDIVSAYLKQVNKKDGKTWKRDVRKKVFEMYPPMPVNV
jgi:hypothetical protein